MHNITLCFLGMGVLLAASVASAQRAVPIFSKETGSLGVLSVPGPMQAPESIVHDLQSSSEDTRLKAFLELGLTDSQVRVTPAQELGPRVAIPDRVQLNYAAIGVDATRQAIVVLQLSELQMTFAALATPSGDGWRRIATFSCWCKYEMIGGEDALAEFVQLSPAPTAGQSQTPQRYELVVRGSGGGTGRYVQNEARFRLRGDELRLVMSFVSHDRSCDPTGPKPHWCEVKKGWFSATAIDGVPSGVLIEGHGKLADVEHFPISWTIRDLGNMAPLQVTCSSFKWNEQSFDYERVKETPDPCMKSLR
ncbi:MAG TPA: hypothetical protein VIX42_07050 [Edaphobacter sp.]